MNPTSVPIPSDGWKRPPDDVGRSVPGDGILWRIAKKAVRNFDAQALRRARRAAGMSQAGLAARLGMARTNYIRFETARSSPSPSTLVGIAQAVGVSPRTLVTTASAEVSLRGLREYAGLSHQGLAQRIGYRDGRSYREIEYGRAEPSSELFNRLAQALGVSGRELRAAWARTLREAR